MGVFLEMKNIETLKKEAQGNIEKFVKELQLLQQRQQLIAQEVLLLQGEIRGYEKQEKEKKEPSETIPKKKGK